MAETEQDGNSTDVNTSTRVWYQGFLSVLSETANVTASCKAVDIDRSTAYKAREQDANFAVLWQDAESAAADKLEAEAWRRAVEGVERPVYQGGQNVGVIREYSDQLMQTLLKGHKPDKFRENRKVEVSGTLVLDNLRERKEESDKREQDLQNNPDLSGIAR